MLPPCSNGDQFGRQALGMEAARPKPARGSVHDSPTPIGEREKQKVSSPIILAFIALSAILMPRAGACAVIQEQAVFTVRAKGGGYR